MRLDRSGRAWKRSRGGARHCARWRGAAGAALLALVAAGCGSIDLGGADYRAEAIVRVDPGLSGEAASGGADIPNKVLKHWQFSTSSRVNDYSSEVFGRLYSAVPYEKKRIVRYMTFDIR